MESGFLQRMRTAARSALAGICRGPVAGAALARFRRPERREESASVHMLVSSRTWHAGLLAAASFEFFTGRRWPLFIHEDGTVGVDARAEIGRVLPGVTFVPRAEADARAAEAFAGCPLSLAHRAKYNLFLKFADTLAYADRERFIVLDSDVLFFREPSEILAWADSGSRECLYNEDTREKFCIPRGEVAARAGAELLPRFNSGLVLMQKAAMRTGRTEEFFAQIGDAAHAPQFFEQTLYALMASENPGGGCALPRTYSISWGLWREKGCISRHYVGDFKHDLLYIEGAPILLSAFRSRRS